MSYSLVSEGNKRIVTQVYDTLEGNPKYVTELELTTPNDASFWGIADDGTTYSVKGKELAIVSLEGLIIAEGKNPLQVTWKPKTMTWKAWTKKWLQRTSVKAR